MKCSFTIAEGRIDGGLFELTTNHPESVAGVPALFVNGELVRSFVSYLPEDDSPPLDKDWTEEDGPKMPTPIRRQYKLFKSRKRRAVKQEVLQRDKHKCRYCGMDLLNDDHGCLSASVDHVIPYEQRTEPTRRRDLVACCSTCNAIKGNRYFQSFKKAKRYVRQERAKRLREAREAAGVAIRSPKRWGRLRRPWAVLAPVLAWLMTWLPLAPHPTRV